MATNLDDVAATIVRLFDKEQFAEARALVESIRHQIPEPLYYYNLALIAHHVGNLSESLQQFERALAGSPGDPRIHWGMSLASLAAGNFERGWREFEWRLKLENNTWRRDFPQPQWTGQNDIGGKTLLLHAEGGLGDALQFVRYVPMVLARSATVVLECQLNLLPLFTQIPGVASVRARGQILPRFDFHCPLQSLPRAFGTTLRSIPAKVPYLAAPVDRQQAWRDKLGERRWPRVGLIWCGSNTSWPKRSRSLAIFAPLSAVSGIELHSLQVGDEAAEERPAGLVVADHSEELRDFAETAALAAQMDLIISVDTSVAHLAGALAREVWVMIPWDPDFRWLRERAESPWYPTMRLFRQATQAKDWVQVMDQITEALRKWLGVGKADRAAG